MTSHRTRLAVAGFTTVLFGLATYYFIAHGVLWNVGAERWEVVLYALAAAGTLSLMLRRGGSVIRLVREHRSEAKA
jgi:hypothetical protein